MSALFGDGSKADTTVLVVDVENGSVASALVRLSNLENPRLFAEHRIALPVTQSVSSTAIFKDIQKALDQSLGETAKVAARIRQHQKLSSQGVINGAHLFFGPPWTSSSWGAGGLEWDFEPSVVKHVRRSAESVVGDAPIQHHSNSWAAAHAASSLAAGRLLVCIMTGEVVELLVVEDGRIEGRATVPLGLHTLLRTLTTHAALSTQEARSALRLYQPTSGESFVFDEPLQAAASHFVEQFAAVAQTLLASSPVSTIVVVAPEPIGAWFARALAESSIAAQFFPDGGTTRDIRTKHLMPYVQTLGTNTDLPLMLEALFTHALRRSEYGIKY